MADDLSLLEKKIEELTAELQHLKGKVESQAEPRNAPQETGEAHISPPISPATTHPQKQSLRSDETMEVTEELLTWAGKASLLPRLSTLCFLLVIALILRTITDNKMIDTLIGSGIGMGYAAALMFAGWVLYRKESPLAPIFSATGRSTGSHWTVESGSVSGDPAAGLGGSPRGSATTFICRPPASISKAWVRPVVTADW